MPDEYDEGDVDLGGKKLGKASGDGKVEEDNRDWDDEKIGRATVAGKQVKSKIGREGQTEQEQIDDIIG